MELTLSRKRLDYAWVFASIFTLSWPVFYPSIRLLFFAPVLIIAYYKRRLDQALWLSLTCGLLIDLLSNNERFGLNSLTYCMTTLILYRQRLNFFADSLSTLPLMTFFFSAVSTLVLAVLLQTFESRHVISLRWILTDLVAMSAIDAFYAFATFTLPPFVYIKFFKHSNWKLRAKRKLSFLYNNIVRIVLSRLRS